MAGPAYLDGRDAVYAIPGQRYTGQKGEIGSGFEKI